jgi:hypothetical protein
VPHLALYEHAVGALRDAGNIPDPRDIYQIAGFEAGVRHRAEFDTHDADVELTGFIQGALAIIDADPDLTDERHSIIVADLLALFAYNTCFDEQVVWAAYDAYEAAKESAA